MNPQRRAELRSIAYHRAIAGRLSPEIVAAARERVRRRLADREGHREHLEIWAQLLDGPTDALAARLVADDETMRAVRQSTPFAGVLGARERWALWRDPEGTGS
jgi:hypothetical protein